MDRNDCLIFKRIYNKSPPGDYHFDTDAAEHIEITKGVVEYRLTENDGWTRIDIGGEIDLPVILCLIFMRLKLLITLILFLNLSL